MTTLRCPNKYIPQCFQNKSSHIARWNSWGSWTQASNWQGPIRTSWALRPLPLRIPHHTHTHIALLLGTHLPPPSSFWLLCPRPHSALPGLPEWSVLGAASELGRQRAWCSWPRWLVCSHPRELRLADVAPGRLWALSPSLPAHSHCPSAGHTLQSLLLPGCVTLSRLLNFSVLCSLTTAEWK